MQSMRALYFIFKGETFRGAL